jgi:hypothetical protein
MHKLLPVIDILNNVRTISNFLYTSQNITLTSDIISNNPALVTEFQNWQIGLWSEFMENYIDFNITATPGQIYSYYIDGFPVADIQNMAKETFMPGGLVTPTFVTAADAVSNLVIQGSTYASSLETIAKSIKNADIAKVAALTALANTLSTQFDSDEEKLASGSIKLGTDLVVTAVNVAIAVGTEGETIQPLISSVSQVGTDIITEINLSSEINATISSLQNAWNDLDKASTELAKITLILNQLNSITNQASTVLKALSNSVSEWQKSVDVTEISSKEWEKSGSDSLKEWCSRMQSVSFSAATQIIQTAEL